MEKRYKVIDLIDTEKAIPLMMEYAREKRENGEVGLSDLSSIMSSLKPDKIYSAGTDKVLPYTIDGDWLICAADEKNSGIVIDEAINFIDSHQDMVGLHVLTPKEELTGKYINAPKLIIDGNTWVE